MAKATVTKSESSSRRSKIAPTEPAFSKVAVKASSSLPVIYADRIVGFGLGMSVSKLILGMETGKNTFDETMQLILPTPSFIESLQFMVKSIDGNPEQKRLLVESLEKFKNSLNK